MKIRRLLHMRQSLLYVTEGSVWYNDKEIESLFGERTSYA